MNGSAEQIGLLRPTEPEYRGRLTLRLLYGIDSKEELERTLREWAEDVWEAYNAQHSIAREWIETALKGRSL
jgi:hypothetical protein